MRGARSDRSASAQWPSLKRTKERAREKNRMVLYRYDSEMEGCSSSPLLGDFHETFTFRLVKEGEHPNQKSPTHISTLATSLATSPSHHLLPPSIHSDPPLCSGRRHGCETLVLRLPPPQSPRGTRRSHTIAHSEAKLEARSRTHHSPHTRGDCRPQILVSCYSHKAALHESDARPLGAERLCRLLAVRLDYIDYNQTKDVVGQALHRR